MRRFWLLFAQTVTIALALYFVYGALRPASRVQQLGSPAKPVPVVETASSSLAPGSYRDAAARAMPAVVNILTLQVPKRGAHPLARDPFFKRFFGDRDPDGEDDEDLKNSLGSGVIVSHEGYVLTNNHVVEGADEIEVVLTDGRKAPAKVVGLDPETDLAVIKINLDKLPVIVLGQSELARVGDVVLAIGNPFGVGQTVTMGIISALGRNNLHINSFENFIQTDAAINFGNSGGALVDTRGNLIGINTAIYSQSGGSVGIGFAIPVSTAKTVMEAIIKDGHVVRGWIGVETQDITPELAQSFNLQRTSGAIIAGVVRNGPADKAGIVPGDILLTVQGKPVGDTTEMLNLIAQLPPGEKAKMTVLRKNREAALDVMVGKRPIPKELSK
ncbi:MULTISPECIES: Do family serine endopeptidase [unclassified Janthinobacterium]|jgi:serine protease DegQ|uniref:Do family serine endopeptidase n=1 Tax=unclassified Janthinobacterium TaxID=2610881 RepID=UPI0008933270|nr:MULTISPECIES: Do family serine endopeptidase [unclassified Janthinobacterium]OEZ68268.1 periplasmic pH-dependent serine endoprotease DegQ precursor [Janthinobacterium sp. HH100]OEZ69309.1 periplasmic pH-dependent serine endoprotease DegQ precursor [Janthinobacterium sp. HH103]OEZ90309.1 periplasmic pH-dependent serine endoprotease DegQ precursor [Janthinobacterium sp. HH106]OEZ93679.1 periplasmic pH-dependent serine endoprotease DegQ precursor [Janthinobacterium sp. HH107]QOU71157.1 Peripla